MFCLFNVLYKNVYSRLLHITNNYVLGILALHKSYKTSALYNSYDPTFRHVHSPACCIGRIIEGIMLCIYKVKYAICKLITFKPNC